MGPGGCTPSLDLETDLLCSAPACKGGGGWGCHQYLCNTVKEETSRGDDSAMAPVRVPTNVFRGWLPAGATRLDSSSGIRTKDQRPALQESNACVLQQRAGQQEEMKVKPVPGLSGVSSKAPDSAVMQMRRETASSHPQPSKKPEHSEGFIGWWSVGMACLHGQPRWGHGAAKGPQWGEHLHTARTSGTSGTGPAGSELGTLGNLGFSPQCRGVTDPNSCNCAYSVCLLHAPL